MKSFRFLIILAALLIFVGCSSDADVDANENDSDVGEQADTNGGDQSDTGADTGADLDTGTDTGADTDTDLDTGTDTGADTGTDTGADTGTDTGPDSGPSTDASTDVDSGPGPGASCGGIVGEEFCRDDEFCRYEREEGVSTCMTNGIGECTTKPTDCPGEDDPVCGCNGQTYSNECLANADGVDVLTTGPCQL